MNFRLNEFLPHVGEVGLAAIKVLMKNFQRVLMTKVATIGNIKK
jgi:hypothetical protein